MAVLYQCGLTIKTFYSTRNGMFTHFEHMDSMVVSIDVNVRLCILYCPPPSKRNCFKNSVFFDEWSLYLDRLAVITNDVIITGDLNFYLDNVNDADAVRFNGTLEAHGLVQHVVGPTHKKGHTLDVVITRDISSLLIGMPTVSEPCLGDTKGNPSGDHLALCFRINLTKPDSVRKPVTFRKLRDICIPEFIKYLTPILNDTDTPLNELVHAYTTGFEAVVDQHAPVQRKSITLRPNAQLYSDELRHVKHAQATRERMAANNQLTVHRQLFKEQCNAVNKLMISAKKTLFSAKIRDCGQDQKQMFKLTCQLMCNTGQVILPTHESAEQLATIFGDFYIDKVAIIRRNINIGNPSDIYETALYNDVMFDGIPLQRFLPATHDEVKRIITNSANKSYDLDPIPTLLLRQCLDHFVPLITAIINKSLATSVVPACFKREVVRPLLKRPGLDNEVLNNYRPEYVLQT